MHTLPAKVSPLYQFACVGALIALAEAIYDLVFANLAYSITGTPSAVTTTYAIGYVAEILVTLLGAGFIDKFDKWKLFIATQVLNIVVFAVAIAVLTVGGRSVAWVWGFAFFVDLIHQYARLVMFALVPFLFLKDELPKVNGLLATLNGVARSLGPVIGAMAILQVGLPLSLSISMLFMIVGLLLAASLYRFHRADPYNPPQGEVSTLNQRFHESVTGAWRATFTLLRSAQWRHFVGSYSACVLTISVLALLWIPLLRDFHLFTAAQTGYLYAVGTTGAILGGLSTQWFSRLNTAPLAAFSAHFIMCAGVLMALLAKHQFLLVGGAMLVFQFGATVYFRTTASLIQLSVPKTMIGSWYGAIDFISRFAGLVGIVLVGWAYDSVGVYWVYSMILLLLVASSLSWLPNRTERVLPNLSI